MHQLWVCVLGQKQQKFASLAQHSAYVTRKKTRAIRAVLFHPSLPVSGVFISPVACAFAISNVFLGLLEAPFTLFSAVTDLNLAAMPA